MGTRGRRQICLGAAMLAASLLVGCEQVGPESISLGRTTYNERTQQTSVEQTLLNIIRVHRNEPTLFMDVSEIDASLTLEATLQSGLAGIGTKPPKGSTSSTKGLVGTVGATVEYAEQPTIRYLPLLGQALVQQLATPITPQSLFYLLSSAPTTSAILPTLDLLVSTMTPGKDDFKVAANAISVLIAGSAVDVGLSNLEPCQGHLESPSQTASRDDNHLLSVYLMPRSVFSHVSSTIHPDALETIRDDLHLWIRLAFIYSNSLISNSKSYSKLPSAQRSDDRKGDSVNSATGGNQKETKDTEENCSKSDGFAIKVSDIIKKPKGDEITGLDIRLYLQKIDGMIDCLTDDVQKKSNSPDMHEQKCAKLLDDMPQLNTLSDVFSAVPTRIDLGAVGKNDSAPILRTYSAIGMLRQSVPGRAEDPFPRNAADNGGTDSPATTGANGIVISNAGENGLPSQYSAFVTPGQLKEIMSEPWNSTDTRKRWSCDDPQFYTIRPLNAASDPSDVAVRKKIDLLNQLTSQDECKIQEDCKFGSKKDPGHICPPDRLPDIPVNEKCLYIMNTRLLGEGDLSQEASSEIELDAARVFLLIVESDRLPTDYPPYAVVNTVGVDGHEHFFYIDGRDEVSQRNFVLISQILTMQAVAPAPALSPSVNVGAH